MLEALWNSVKGMFVNEDGGIKWGTLIGLGGGAAAGYFLLPMIPFLAGSPVIAAAIGAVVGLVGSQVVQNFMTPSPEPVQTPVRGGTPVADNTPHRGGGPQVQHTPPGGSIQQPRGAAVGPQ